MVKSSDADDKMVIFLAPNQQLDIRMMDRSGDAICNAARTLKATHFVCIDGWSIAEDAPIWGVFEMRRADPNGGGPGRWSIPDPIKTYVGAAADGAIMYAIHKSRSAA